jgi:hypothetical protein
MMREEEPPRDGTDVPGVIQSWDLGVPAAAANAVGNSLDALVKRLAPGERQTLVRRINQAPVIIITTPRVEAKAAALPWLAGLMQAVVAGDIVAHEDKYRDALMETVRNTAIVIEHILQTR